MLFFKAEGTLIDSGAGNDNHRRAQRENNRKILLRSERFNQKRGQDNFCFLAELADNFMTVGMILSSAENAEAIWEAAYSHPALTDDRLLGILLEEAL